MLTSFEDQEKLAEAKTSDEANVLAWEKLDEKNKAAISNDLSKEDQKRLLYLLTFNKPKDLVMEILYRIYYLLVVQKLKMYLLMRQKRSLSLI